MGQLLHQARVDHGITLSGVRDRTGVPWYQLEALEGGAIGRFPDQDSLLTALRRFADVVGVDAQRLAPVLWEAWGTGAAGAAQTPGPAGLAPVGPAGLAPASAGGLAPASAGSRSGRRPGAVDGPVAPAVRNGELHHLRHGADAEPGPTTGVPGATGRVPVTARVGPGIDAATAPVPVVSAAPRPVTPAHLTATATVPAVGSRPPRRKAPLLLRLLVWSTAVALAAAAATLELHRVVPRWVRSARSFVSSITNGSSSTSGPAGSVPRTSTPGSSKSPSANRSGIVVTQGAAGTTITMPSSRYRVVVTDVAPAWMSVSAPAGGRQLFSGVLQPGQAHAFTPSGGELAIVFGGVHVKVTAQVGGTAVPHWSFVPAQAPTTVTFTGPGSAPTTTAPAQTTAPPGTAPPGTAPTTTAPAQTTAPTTTAPAQTTTAPTTTTAPPKPTSPTTAPPGAAPPGTAPTTTAPTGTAPTPKPTRPAATAPPAPTRP